MGQKVAFAFRPVTQEQCSQQMSPFWCHCHTNYLRETTLSKVVTIWSWMLSSRFSPTRAEGREGMIPQHERGFLSIMCCFLECKEGDFWVHWQCLYYDSCQAWRKWCSGREILQPESCWVSRLLCQHRKKIWEAQLQLESASPLPFWHSSSAAPREDL